MLATNRAKRSRGQKSTNSRFFSIRYTIAGSDRFVEFDSNDYQDIELRSKDVFILSYISGQVRVIQNLTVAAYWPINKPTQGCLVIVMVIGLGLAIIPALAMMA
ncbi:hypothetical protein AL073_02860 [Loktanella sp. 1ANDIMAR09]|nr:hypothetical protein AL073_02860 [Loktanella sp. 1ANDIMAR09]